MAKGSRYVVFISLVFISFFLPFSGWQTYVFGNLIFLQTNWVGFCSSIRKAKEEATKKGWCDTELSSNKAIREEKTDAVESLQSDIDEMTAQIAKLGNEVKFGEGRPFGEVWERGVNLLKWLFVLQV